MTLGQVLDGVVVTKLVHKEPWQGPQALGVAVEDIRHDSRLVRHGSVYVAIRGERTDGHRFIPDVIARGAVAVVVEDDSTHPDSFFTHAHVVKVVVPRARTAMARMARNLFGDPSRRLTLIGVTGTNGKTTTTHLMRGILEADGQTAGLLGTMGYHDGVRTVDAVHTTPEAPELNRMLSEMVRNGCTGAVMEVSSHSLIMERVGGLKFSAAAFTNLTQDHLDFHGSMERYFSAKKMLFDALDGDAVAVTNIDDPRGGEIVADTAGRRVTYGSRPEADVRTLSVTASLQGTRVTIRSGGRSHDVASPLIGTFNAANMTAAFATAVGLGLPAESAVQGIAAVASVRGRFEAIQGSGWTAVVDYAHTPDALERALTSLRALLKPPGRIITVFGCGGDRDRGKRPVMGSIAARLSDSTIVTSDNPRSEDPEQIIREILGGMKGNPAVRQETDRRSAIHAALALARPGDAVLIAGKGHETYQIVGETKTHLDDREEVLTFLRAGR